MDISEQLLEVQAKLKVPKDHKNTFGNYNYRNCEDILETAKPLLKANGLTLVLDDKVEQVGTHNYIQATATLTNSEKQTISNHGYAREAETKKGMDDSQITGTASSYARKYALNGLFLIDDTKDADTDEYQGQPSKPPQNIEQPLQCISAKNALYVHEFAKEKGITEKLLLANVKGNCRVDSVEKMTKPQFDMIVAWLTAKKA